jgi:hypothetical protein
MALRKLGVCGLVSVAWMSAARPAAAQQCVVGVVGGGNGVELPQLQSTLSSLGFVQTVIATTADATAANANVIIDRYDASNIASGPITTWLNTGKGYIELGDWSGYFANTFVGFSASPITVTVTNPASPLAAGLPASWIGSGFWAYDGGGTNYIDSATNLAFPDVLHAQQASTVYDHVATTQLVGTGRAAFIGINVYGSVAGPNDTRLLSNAVTWAGACAAVSVPTTSTLGLVIFGALMALAAVFVIARVR